MRTRHLSGLLIVAILILSTAPLYAQGAQPDLAKLKAETQKAVSIISEDKAKTQAFCEIESLVPQFERAAQEKDEKKVEALTQKTSELEKQLGPEYLALIDAVSGLDPDSKDTQEIISIFNRLDESCRH